MPPIEIGRLCRNAPDFYERLDARLVWADERDATVEATVRTIIDDVRTRGDEAVVELTNRFDRREVTGIGDLRLAPTSLVAAYEGIAREDRDALEVAAQRIRRFHEHQKQTSWTVAEHDGSRLGQRITPLDRVGIYVPGGKAAYPSSVLMNAVPASVAEVPDVVMAVPAPGGELNPLVLAAAHIAGVTEAYTMGGAQAVAALAYGTDGIAPVDKIVGPGNAYVATAKRLVFGQVGIDMVAGPSEIVIICDGETPPDWIAADLFSQAEHDEDARAILISPDAAFLDAVHASLEALLPRLERHDIIRESLRTRGTLIEVGDLSEAAEVANHLAPEHLELSVRDPDGLLAEIRHAGAIFLGSHTSEVLGDYCAGPNHVLPTGRTARFSSPLGVYDFQKRTSVIHCSASAASELAGVAGRLARGEGLVAHALAAEIRTNRG
ncbi:MAG: histidinol dehydrogenase [Pseudomonadota bacterium]